MFPTLVRKKLFLEGEKLGKHCLHRWLHDPRSEEIIIIISFIELLLYTKHFTYII